MKDEKIYHIITATALIIALGLLIKPVCNEPKLPTPPRDSIITIINEKTKYYR